MNVYREKNMDEMSEEQRENIRAANKRRAGHLCGNCQAVTHVRDGAEIGGMPGINYRVCGSCGWNRAITKRPRREKLR